MQPCATIAPLVSARQDVLRLIRLRALPGASRACRAEERPRTAKHAAKQLLRLLYNCEHVLERAAALAGVLARSCERLVTRGADMDWDQALAYTLTQAAQAALQALAVTGTSRRQVNEWFCGGELKIPAVRDLR